MIKRKNICVPIIMGLILCILCNCSVKTPVVNKLVEDDFFVSYKGIQQVIGFDVNANQFISSFGEPVITTVFEDTDRPEWTILEYSWKFLTLEVFKGSGKINHLTILGKDIKTKRGISIGDSLSKVIEKYGIPAAGENSERLGYNIPTNDSVWGMLFILKNKKVEKIDIAREP